ncbi:MAG: hypothetical protein ACOY0R_06880 [Chloroflexota bacterium]
MTTTTSPAQSPGKPKEAHAAARAAAAILAIFFVITALAGLIGFDIWRVVFNPTLVKQALTAEIVSSDVAPAVLQLFSEQRARQRVESGEALSGVSEPDIVLLISYVDADGWRKIKQLMLSDEFVTHLVSVSVDSLYQWIDSDAPWPSLTWDMTPLKERVAGEQGQQAIQVAYLSMPVCTDAEIADLKKRLAEMPPGVEVLYNLCQFPDPWHEDQVSDYRNSLIDINQNVPTQYNFGEMLTQNPSANPTAIKAQLRLVRSIGQWGWAAALALLLAIAGLAVRSPRSLGKFIGIPLFITGITAALVAWRGQASIINFFTSTMLAQTSPFVREEVERSLARLTGLFFQPLLIEGIVLTVIGMGLVALIFVHRQKERPETQAG